MISTPRSRAAAVAGATLAVLVGTLAAPGRTQEPERVKRLPAGSTIAGVDVGGLGPIATERRVRQVLGAVYEAPVTVRAGRRAHTVLPLRAGLAIDYEYMVDRAFRVARRTRPADVPLRSRVYSEPLRARVREIAARATRSPRNARVRFGITRVVRIRHRTGQAVDGARLERLLRDELRTPSVERAVTAPLRRLLPRITTGDLARIHHTYVSVDRGTFTLRLFRRLHLTRRYRVAVGAAGYETPRGLRRVLSKQVNPAWTAPNRPWAGALAGQTIPPGDPRNPLRARFIGLGDGIGIHGTSEEWSIGTRASHGCIRMRVGDVKDLYRRVALGTPVRIR